MSYEPTPTGEDAVIEGEAVTPGPVFRYLNPRDPLKARRRVGEVYWKGWRRLIMSSLLLLFGLTFTLIGLFCMKLCTEFDRGVAFFIVGMIMLMPGAYGSLTLLMFVRCKPGFTYEQLPEFEY